MYEYLLKIQHKTSMINILLRWYMNNTVVCEALAVVHVAVYNIEERFCWYCIVALIEGDAMKL